MLLKNRENDNKNKIIQYNNKFMSNKLYVDDILTIY